MIILIILIRTKRRHQSSIGQSFLFFFFFLLTAAYPVRTVLFGNFKECVSSLGLLPPMTHTKLFKPYLPGCC